MKKELPIPDWDYITKNHEKLLNQLHDIFPDTSSVVLEIIADFVCTGNFRLFNASVACPCGYPALSDLRLYRNNCFDFWLITVGCNGRTHECDVVASATGTWSDMHWFDSWLVCTLKFDYSIGKGPVVKETRYIIASYDRYFAFKTIEEALSFASKEKKCSCSRKILKWPFYQWKDFEEVNPTFREMVDFFSRVIPDQEVCFCCMRNVILTNMEEYIRKYLRVI
jgi:hypothetical protein